MAGPSNHRPLVAVLVAAIVGMAGECGSAGRSPPPSTGLAPVTKVTDGDTLHVSYQGQDERVRLIGVDSPEMAWYGGEGECFGNEAALYARGRLSDLSVGLQFDRERRDRFGRLLAYVYLDGELFNLTLVTRGYARADPVPPNTSRAGEFSEAEEEARSEGRGLWSACSLDA
jgi:micrococcal nuclease